MEEVRPKILLNSKLKFYIGLLVSPEQCDDGNWINGDGCNTDWQVEQGWDWTPTNNSVWTPKWGDGLKVGSEGWDAGTQPGWKSDWSDFEQGYDCTFDGTKDVWTPTWGDGIRIDPEQWDDGNLTLGIGWDNWIILQGWTCTDQLVLGHNER